MKAVILAGGFGTRISEETIVKPKPLVEIGGRPILWHIMKIYSAHNINDFIICLGYKGYMIKEYFANYVLHMSDVTIDIANNNLSVHQNNAEPWRVTLVDTGESSLTGGRLRRVQPYIGTEDFCFTYGDGVGDVNISRVIDFHKSHGRLATLTATQPPGRFGALTISEKLVVGFNEKPRGDGGWVNAGFFVLSPKVVNYIDGDDVMWEQEPLARLAKEKQLAAYRHEGFWQPVDTMRDKVVLEKLWASGDAPWRVWDD
ncbi:MAG: glucose-1-phosphate cytidylyltransferase [Gammaproteobacteria bacterium RIFCSPLOWO2_02_FULL_56_15]|nr:MAG: glucose-1-phosphate cytidylyltransferase [Gammaproteobacteria bacterium RIFCSPLOWO2_02_FULL_56_15]